MTTPSSSESVSPSESVSTESDVENKIPSNTVEVEPSFGWNQYAEKVNGRFAMIGFIALLVTEFFTQQDFFSWIGLR
ncbi:MAG: chlorophyll a/b-binding protein [Phormidesmis sp.]